MADPIYKIMTRNEWDETNRTGVFHGAPVDLADGYIHFSTALQVRETAAKHFAGKDDLVLVAVDPDHFGDAMRWEPSRGGGLFPHLYAPLERGAVRSAHPLRLDGSGQHVFPDEAASGGVAP